MKKFLLYSLGVLLLMGFLFLDNSQAHRYTPYQGNTGIDVQNYKIEILNIDRDTQVIDFKTTITAKAISNFSSGERFGLDFVDTYQISEVLFNNQTINSGNYRITYTGSISLSGTNKKLEINLPSNISVSGDIVVVVSYSGVPKFDIDNSGLGFYNTGIELHAFNEPLGAHQWFPCNDVPWDKATLDFYTTTLTGKVVLGNGKLMQDTDNGNGTHTVYRKEYYPISTYNVYVGAGPFTYVYSGTSPFLSGSNNIIGFSKTSNTTLSNNIKDLSTSTGLLFKMIDVLGPYPYQNEKLGFVMRPINMWMEHNTMIGLYSTSPSIFRHEIVHQWMGNYVSHHTWPDIWITEGAATYFEQVVNIGKSNRQNASYALSTAKDWTRKLNDPSATNLFSSTLVYNRAARIYHHLRSYLGEDLFFSGLSYYINKHAYSTVTTEQFRQTREESSNKDLNLFFNRFVYGTGEPKLLVTSFYDNINDGTYSGRAFFKLSRADNKARTPDAVFAEINYTDGSTGEVRIFQENSDSYVVVNTNKEINNVIVDAGSGTTGRKSDYPGLLYKSGYSVQDDSDSDALPDGWEYIIFGDLNQTAEGDYDNDGITNLDEYDLTIGEAITAEIFYSDTNPTSDDVISTITGFNKTGITILNNSGSNNYVFTGNGSFLFTFQDGEGNIGSLAANVNWIDKSLMISSTTPTNGTTGISLSGEISIQFSKSMNHGSVEENISITPQINGINFQREGNKLIINHDNMDENTTYYVTIGSETEDSNGNKLWNDYFFHFKSISYQTGTALLNFLSNTFWNTNPSESQIKSKIFGDILDLESSYTTLWTDNPCGTANINIVNIQNFDEVGLNSIPKTLQENTIYILDTGRYITDGTINFNGNCIAIIGKGDVEVYSNDRISGNYGIFKASGKSNLVIDNIDINGLNNGSGEYRGEGSLSSGNQNGIYFDGVNNSTLNNMIVSYNSYGFNFNGGNNNIISNSISFNNLLRGIYSNNSNNNYILNSNILNNANKGIELINNQNVFIQNSQIYNNGFYGIHFDGGSGNVVSNCMSYNNSRHGLYFQSSNNNIVYNSAFYNNSYTGLRENSSTGNKYYGDILLFANAGTAANGTSIEKGLASDEKVSGLGWEDGNIISGISISYDYISNPLLSDGQYLLTGTNWSTNRKRKDISQVEIESFEYGNQILKQIQFIEYGYLNLALSDIIYDNSKYIAEFGFDDNYVDYEPNSFLFNDILDAELNTIYTSNIITIGGLSEGVYVDIYLNGSGIIYKNGSNVGNSASGTNGDQIYISMESDNNYNSTLSAELFIGDISDIFNLTTKQDPNSAYPDFDFSNNSGYECEQGELLISGAIDNVVGLSNFPYSFDGLSRGTSNILVIDQQQAGSIIKTGYVKNLIGNQTIKIATYTFNNVGISANNFTGNANVGNSSKTGNWKILSNANEGNCGSSSIVYSGISTQGTKGTCSVAGDIITYTPNSNKIGNDSCIIIVKDDENSTGIINIYRGGIDTVSPDIVTCTNSQSFENSISISCSASEGTIKYTDNGSNPTCNGNTWSDQIIEETTTIKIIACDSYNNASNINTYVYSKNTNQLTTGSMSWTGDTPQMGEIIADTGVNISLDINDSNLEKFNRNMNGENFDIYNENLVFMTNANNISELGENTTILKDISNYSNHGTISGATRTGEGRDGNSLLFRGGTTNDKVIITDNNSLDMITGFTISARINPTAFVADGVIIGRPHSSATAPHINYGLGYSSNTSKAFQVAIGGSSQKICNAATGSALTGVFSHVVGVFEYNKLKIYINGVLSNTCLFAQMPINNVDMPLYLGYYPYWNGIYSFKGMLDDIMIYNKALNADQIQILYKSHLNKHNLEDWRFSIDYDGLNPGVYTYTGLAQSIGGYQYRLNRDFVVYDNNDIVVLPSSSDSQSIVNEFLNKGYTQNNGELIGSKGILLKNPNGIIKTNLSIRNNNNKVYIPNNVTLKKKSDLSNFEGIIIPPTDITVNNLDDVIKAIRVGSENESLELDGGVATITIPAPGKNSGDPVSIYYSEDNGATWDFHANDTVELIGGQPNVMFTTDHFTDFAITLPPNQGGGSFSGSFVINNDNSSTNSQNVTLNISTTPAANQMRFSNDGSNRSSWIAYNTSYNRILSASAGNKIVYAEFDSDGDNVADAQTNDSINYVVSGGGGYICGDLLGGPGYALGCIVLDVTAGTGSCGYTTDLTITSIASSYNTGLTNGTYQDPFRCEDLQGTQTSWSLTLEQTTDLVNNSNTNYIIPKENVSVKSNNSTVVNGACSIYAGTTSFSSIGDGTPETILGKNNDQGAICKIEAQNVMLQVETIANQPVGTYTGTIQVVYPSFL